jgi:hypothetical protein
MAAGAGQITKKKRKRQPEQVFQGSLIKTLGLVLQPQRTFVFAVPNGGWRSKAEAAILIGQGVVPGVPDLMVLFDGTAIGLELKAPKGIASKKQQDVHKRFASAGIPVGIVRTDAEAIAFLKANGAPMRLVGGA